MDFEPFGGGRTIGFGTWFGQGAPFSPTSEFKWTFAGKWGAVIGALWTAQAAAGALAGAGTSWAGAHETRGAFVSQRYLPNLTLGSTYFYAKAGNILHVTCDADIRIGEVRVYVWRMPGIENNSPTTEINKTGVREFDIPIKETGFYTIMHSGDDVYSQLKSMPEERMRVDLKYKLSWKLER